MLDTTLYLGTVLARVDCTRLRAGNAYQLIDEHAQV